MTDLANDLIEAANEAAAFMRGENTGAVAHAVPSAKDIRDKAGLTQEQMAPLLGMSLSGYRKIEQGKRAISGPASVLLRVLERDPKAVQEALANPA